MVNVEKMSRQLFNTGSGTCLDMVVLSKFGQRLY